MKLRVFSIAAHGDSSTADELNAFLSSHRIRDVDKRFVDDGARSFWSLAVTYLDGDDAQARPGSGTHANHRQRIDYRDVLNPKEFAAYAALRELRKQWAARDGVPPYHVLTNEQLAALVQGRKRTRVELEAIDGFGPARLAKYGEELLAALAQHIPAIDVPTAQPSA